MNANKLSNPNYRRSLKTASVIAAGGIALSACSSESDNTLSNFDQFRPHTEFISVTLEDNAILRSESNTGGDYSSSPDVESNNRLVQLDLESDQSISTEDGIVIATDFENGDWYGIPVRDLIENESIAAQLPDSLTDPSVDPESVVWVSSQKALKSKE